MKKVLFVLIGIIIVLFLFTYISGKSIVFDSSSQASNEYIKCKDGMVNPFGSFNFNSDDDWKLYVVFKGNDLSQLPEGIIKANYLFTSDIEVLNKIKSNWNFKCTESDMATVESQLVLLKNGDKVFHSGIAVNENINGLQSRDFGWIESGQITKDLKLLNRSYSPIIFL